MLGLWMLAIVSFALSILAITGRGPERWRGRERQLAARAAGIGAVLVAVAVLGWVGWLDALTGVGMLVLSGFAVTRVRRHGFDVLFGAAVAFGAAVVLIPGGVYWQTKDDMHGAAPILVLAGMALIVAVIVAFVVRFSCRLMRLPRQNGSNPHQ